MRAGAEGDKRNAGWRWVGEGSGRRAKVMERPEVLTIGRLKG